MKFDTAYMSICAYNQHKGRVKDRMKAHFEYTYLCMIEAIAHKRTHSAWSYEQECLNLITALEMTEIITHKEGDELFECVNTASIWLH